METKTVTPLSRYRLTADGVAVNSDFLLVKGLITGDGTNHGKAVIYSGLDTGGEKILTLRVTANKSEKIGLTPGIKVKDGVYIDITDIEEIVIFGYVLNP